MRSKSVRQFRTDRIEVHAAALLEVGELRDLQAIEHHLPADAPRSQRRRFPIVFFELDVMLPQGQSPARPSDSRYSSCTFSGGGFRITCSCMCLNNRFGFSPYRPSAGRRDGCTYATLYGFGPKHSQKRLRRHRARADLNVVRLLKNAPSFSPKALQLEDQFLKRRRIGFRTRQDSQAQCQ